MAWAEESGHRRAGGPVRGGLRFAFYGRVSTEDWQDPVTSRARQRDQAAALVAGHGMIVAEFFDAGESRTHYRTPRPARSPAGSAGEAGRAPCTGSAEQGPGESVVGHVPCLAAHTPARSVTGWPQARAARPHSGQGAPHRLPRGQDGARHCEMVQQRQGLRLHRGRGRPGRVRAQQRDHRCAPAAWRKGRRSSSTSARARRDPRRKTSGLPADAPAGTSRRQAAAASSVSAPVWASAGGLQVTQGVGGGVQAQFQLGGRPVADVGTRSKIASAFFRLLQRQLRLDLPDKAARALLRLPTGGESRGLRGQAAELARPSGRR